MNESMKSALTNAFSAVKKEFKEGDLVVFKYPNRDMLFVENKTGFKFILQVKKVSNVSYDLKLFITDEELEKYRKIVNESFGWREPSFECWERYKKKNTPHSDDEIMLADFIILNQSFYHQSEDLLVKFEG